MTPTRKRRLIATILILTGVSVASAIVWLLLKVTIGIRLESEFEALGIDKAELGLEAYPEFGQGSQAF